MSTPKSERWSKEVTETSHALDLEPGVFTKEDPRAIARSLKRSAERSTERKSDPYRSAMSMLTFYINRAAATCPKKSASDWRRRRMNCGSCIDGKPSSLHLSEITSMGYSLRRDNSRVFVVMEL